MWRLFKLLSVWFCLGGLSLLVGLYFLGAAHPGAANAVSAVRHPGPSDHWAFAVAVVPLLMIIPAYFLSRPKR